MTPFMLEGKGDTAKIVMLILSRKDFLSRIIFCHLLVHNIVSTIAVEVSNNFYVEAIRAIRSTCHQRS